MRTLFKALLLSTLLPLAIWLMTGQKVAPVVSIGALLPSLSYTPYVGFERTIATNEQLKRDFDLLSKVTKKVRTYAVQDAFLIAPYVRAHNMRIDLGIWLGPDAQENAYELMRAREFLRFYQPLVETIIVGNEVLLRDDLKSEELIAAIEKVRLMSALPITTAEIWSVWAKNSKLAEAVDFINVHILPYWERIDTHETMTFTKERMEELQTLYPDKKVVIGEFGWPSRGYNNRAAKASPMLQIEMIGSFVALAQREGWSYNIVEAFDQPWKGVHEGSVGPYWGLYNAKREPKFRFDQETLLNPYWPYQMALSILFGLLFAFFGLRHQRANLSHATTYALSAQAMGFGLSVALFYPFVNYMNAGMWFMWAMGIVLMLPLAVTTLAKVNELFKCTMGFEPQRLIAPNENATYAPFVSIHVPAYKEQPSVLSETLRALSKLDYANYEVLVIINNTPEAFYTEPIEALCKELGERFVFLNITCKGFKAGALNDALHYTSPKAEIIAVLDADYVVSEDWLRDLLPLFEDPKVAIVQAPQDHRDGEESLIKAAMNAEYMGFFDIGMVIRNEENAIVAHGTMLMVRLSAMMEVGGWGVDTIVEDSELGLRLFEAGYSAHYTDRRYGWGLLPDTIEAFKNQRHRWAYGAIQILKKHWRHFKPEATTLSPQQKHHFVSGWLLWLFDAMGPLTAMLNVIWVPVILLVGVTIPTLSLTLPIVTAFLVNILHAFILYRHRVGVGFRESLLGAIAAMSLQLTIFKAVYDGFVRDGLPFKRTEKGGNTKKKTANPIFYETLLGSALFIGATALVVFNTSAITEVYIFALTLYIQAVPYASALILRRIELYSQRS